MFNWLGISLFECNSRKDLRSCEMFKVIRTRGIVTKETVVFIGPDLGHARAITPADQRRRWIHPLSVILLAPSLVKQLAHLPSQKIASSRWRVRSLPAIMRLGTRLIIRVKRMKSRRKKEGNQIYYLPFDTDRRDEELSLKIIFNFCRK